MAASEPAPAGAVPRRSWAPFVAVECATTLSGIGNGITTVALPWLVLERTGSATAAGALAAITALPTMAAALLSGTVVDRVGRRRVSVTSDVLSLISAALIPTLDRGIGLQFGWLVVLAVMGAVFDPAGMGAREAMVPEAAAAARLSLPRANGVHEAVWGGAYVLGPAIGGVLIGVIGTAATFWATALMFAGSAIVVASTRVPGAGRPTRLDAGDESFWPATGRGLRFVARDRLLRSIAVFLMLLSAIWLPIEGVILPVYFEQQDRPTALGVVLMALSVGGIAGSLAFSVVAHRFRIRVVFLAGLVATGAFTVAAATLPDLLWLTLLAAGAGFSYGPIGPIMNVAMQSRTPSALRGRVIGLLTAVQYAAGPVGFILAGPLVDAVGVDSAFMLLGILLASVCVASPAVRSLAELDTLRTSGPPVIEPPQPPRPLT